MKRRNNINADEKAPLDSGSIKSLIADLAAKDKDRRAKAHDALIAASDSATPVLVRALCDPRERVRWEVMKILDEAKVDWKRHADEATVEALVADLGSDDGLVRVRARKALVTIGAKSVGALEEALASRNEAKRWEAAKALGQIGDSAAAGALVRALEDEDFDVRWLAAEGLVAIGERALAPLLRKVVERSNSEWLREGAHHVLHGMTRGNVSGILRPVMSALEDSEAPLQVPIAAESALAKLAKSAARK